jgi:hypothetical protein
MSVDLERETAQKNRDRTQVVSKEFAAQEGVSKTDNVIGDPMEILLDESTRVNVRDTLKLKRKKNGQDVIFEVGIRVLEAPEYDRINDECTEITKNKRSGAINKEVNQKQFRRMVAYEGLINPQMNDPKIVEKYHPVKGKEWEILDKVFFAGELDYIATEVMKLSGYNDDFVETVKNS